MALFELIQHTEAEETPEPTPLTFKEAALSDVDEIFFDITEHAEMHLVDGKEMPVIIDEERLQDHSAHWEAGAKQNFDTGLYNAYTILYVKVSDYGSRPKVGKLLVLDEGTDYKRTYTIQKCNGEDGVYRMIMTRTRQ